MIRKSFAIMVVFFISQPFLFSQTTDTITEKEVGRIIRYFASDSLRGRGNGRPELLKAGLFIGDYFRKNNLQPLPGFPGYYLPFRPFGGSNKAVTDDLNWNGNSVPDEQFNYISAVPGNYGTKTLRDFTVMKWQSFFTEDMLKELPKDNSSLLIWTDKKQPDGKNFFPEKISMPAGGMKRSVLLVYAESAPRSISLVGNMNYYSMLEYNVVGVLPGKTKLNEVILFSAHYDHEGVFPGRKDSIMNGANDNASGTTALLMLANYFSLRNDNARTIMFCAFAAEEMGLLGSTDFVKIIDPDKIIAGINIEMIGVTQMGKNRVFITGERFSNLATMLRKNIKNTPVRFGIDSDESKQLFQRSDNYPFVLKGIPAHSIMGADDTYPCYHQPCDEIRTINIPNMTRIIKAIAASVRTLINGEDTPYRITKESLK